MSCKVFFGSTYLFCPDCKLTEGKNNILYLMYLSQLHGLSKHLRNNCSLSVKHCESYSFLLWKVLPNFSVPNGYRKVEVHQVHFCFYILLTIFFPYPSNSIIQIIFFLKKLSWKHPHYTFWYMANFKMPIFTDVASNFPQILLIFIFPLAWKQCELQDRETVDGSSTTVLAYNIWSDKIIYKTLKDKTWGSSSWNFIILKIIGLYGSPKAFLFSLLLKHLNIRPFQTYITTRIALNTTAYYQHPLHAKFHISLS